MNAIFNTQNSENRVMAEGSPQIDSILEELRRLNNNLSDEPKFYEDFVQFKGEYFRRNEDFSDTLRGLRSDMRYQNEDINQLQTDVGELKQGFQSMKIDLEPIMELKTFVRGQVFRYTSALMAVLLAAVVGIGGV